MFKFNEFKEIIKRFLNRKKHPMLVKNLKIGMIFKNVDWDGPSTVVVIKVESEGIMICRLNPISNRPEETSVWLTNTPYGDERELLLEGQLIFGGI